MNAPRVRFDRATIVVALLTSLVLLAALATPAVAGDGNATTEQAENDTESVTPTEERYGAWVSHVVGLVSLVSLVSGTLILYRL